MNLDPTSIIPVLGLLGAPYIWECGLKLPLRVFCFHPALSVTCPLMGPKRLFERPID
jgi:hypothetical protein